MAGMAPLERPGTPENSLPLPSWSDRTVLGSTAIEQSGDALVTVARPLFDEPTKTLEQRGAPVSRLAAGAPYDRQTKFERAPPIVSATRRGLDRKIDINKFKTSQRDPHRISRRP